VQSASDDVAKKDKYIKLFDKVWIAGQIDDANEELIKKESTTNENNKIIKNKNKNKLTQDLISRRKKTLHEESNSFPSDGKNREKVVRGKPNQSFWTRILKCNSPNSGFPKTCEKLQAHQR
tara:strand:+ start:1979 stop:2341 length:363 start_codon:yes stop_codon:yes gene_type:complete